MSKKPRAPIQEPLFKEVDIGSLREVETIPDDKANKYSFETVDFSDPNRPKTCLEVDFPILRVNEISAIENNATKPIYMMSKWWARRRSSVFRQLLISAATKAPPKAGDAAQTSWALMYRKSHQKHAKFSKLKVVDIFMGGGTTVVEAARLGFQVTGIDLNPIAWWIVKNETTPVEPKRVDDFATYIEEAVKPQIMPFYTAASPRGYAGKWVDAKSGEKVAIDPINVAPAERHKYKWIGPEVIYTFWMKHIMCSDPNCFHLTPQVNSSFVAEKTIKLKTWANCVCPKCGETFDLEAGDFRISPEAKLVLAKDQEPFASIDQAKLKAKCPHCKHTLDADWIAGQERRKGKPISKEITHYLVLSKKWLKGITGKSKDYFGGYYGATQQQDGRWFQERSENLALVEVRGEIPAELQQSNFAQTEPNDEGETKSSGELICGKCGRQQEPLSALRTMGHMAPIFPYCVQGVDPEAKLKKHPYGGRFFALPDLARIAKSFEELGSRKDLKDWTPDEPLWFGHETHQRQLLPAHGYTHWYKMFNPRQLYVNALLAKTISDAPSEIAGSEIKSHALGAFQNYLRHNCMFTIWDREYDKLVPHFSNNNYHPKATSVENGVFSDLGRGNFSSCIQNVSKGLQFAGEPYDLRVAGEDEQGKSAKVPSEDPVRSSSVTLICGSSTSLKGKITDGSVDLVITDPPFGDNVNYAEMADFFLIWLQRPLSLLFPQEFASAESPKSLEAVTNKARNPGENEDGSKQADVMYDRLLTLCWKEAHRILKPSGIMAFTFHHDKDIAWIGVLESLFKAGFLIEGAFPIRSDETKGDGGFGSKKIEFDVVHVCRKREDIAKEIYWATLRKQILEAVRSSSAVLAQHRLSGLHLADLEVIIRGKVLEQYSKHYGKVKRNLAGDPMSVREILLEANSIALSLLQKNEEDRIPDGIDPETRVLFTLLREGPAITRDAASKRLKGSGVTIDDLIANGWVEHGKKQGQRIIQLINPLDRWNSLARKNQLKSDLDQVHFAINCCVGGRIFRDHPADWEKWISENYKSLLPTVGPILKFIEANHFGAEHRQAIGIAYRTLERGLQKARENDAEFKAVFKEMNIQTGTRG